MLKKKKSLYLEQSLDAYKNAVKPAVEGGGATEEDEQHDDAWLNYYMFGKIKEKLKADLFDCLECYLKVRAGVLEICFNLNALNFSLWSILTLQAQNTKRNTAVAALIQQIII